MILLEITRNKEYYVSNYKPKFYSAVEQIRLVFCETKGMILIISS